MNIKRALYLFMAAALSLHAMTVPAAEGNQGDPHYLQMHPAFTVNLKSEKKSHYLQLVVQLMSHDEQDLEAAKKNMPALRHYLILLFSSQDDKALRSMEGKQGLLEEALKTVQETLREETGKPHIEGLYFTTFVIQ